MDGLKRHHCSAICFLLVAIWFPSHVSARGRMMEPPQRSSLFNRGFNAPVNDDDSALNCGGPWRQHEVNDGKCGVCGDPYDAIVRENEAGGKYANGIIANTYTTNDTSILVVIDIQNFLKGHFEFRICPQNNVEVSVKQTCLDRFPLRVWDLTDNRPDYRYYPKGVGLHSLRVELPRGLTCTQCVLQWKWQTGTNWGRCPNGLYKTGCGPQEEYYNCADIAIVPATDKEYKHAYPQVPRMPSSNTNTVPITQPDLGIQPGIQPWTSVEFVSHDAKTVVELKNKTTSDMPFINVYHPKPVPVQNAPATFLPKEAIQVLPEEPVKPKFDFYDPSITSTVDAGVKVLETRTEPIVPVDVIQQITTLGTSSLGKAKKDVVVLPYNGMTSDTVVDSTAVEYTTDPVAVRNTVSQESATKVSELKSDAATESVVSDGSSTTNSMSTAAFDRVPQPRPTSASITFSSTDGTTKEASTRNFDIRTFTGINITTPNIAEHHDASTTRLTHSSTTGGQGSTLETATQPFSEMSTGQHAMASTFGDTSPKEVRPTISSLKIDLSTKPLSRHTRQAGMKFPPPPPPAADGPTAAVPVNKLPKRHHSPSAMYEPARPAPATIQNEVVIQQQYTRGQAISDPSASSQLGAEMMGAEALGEPGSPGGIEVGVAAQPSYPLSLGPPVQSAAPAPEQPVPPQGSGPQDRSMSPMLAGPGPDPGLGASGEIIVDNTVPYEQPRIPRPPEVSAAEIEKAIADTPIVLSPVSDSGKPMDASAILGTTYIAGFQEAHSNVEETFTASKQGTMIVNPNLSSPKTRAAKGSSAEYLSPTQGTSASDKPSETVAQVPETAYSASLGFMPTPEQLMTGMRGITRPAPADTTNLEPTGPAPPDPNAQNVAEAKDALIRELGAAMGLIPTDTQQPVPDTPPPQTANLVPDQNIATVLAMAAAGSQTSAGPIATTIDSMVNNQAQRQGMQATQTMTSEQIKQPTQAMLSDLLQSQAMQQAALKQQKAMQQTALEQAMRQAAIEQQQAMKQALLKQQAMQQAAMEQAARQAAIKQQQAMKQAVLEQQKAMQQAAIKEAARQAVIKQQAMKQAALEQQAARQAAIEQQQALAQAAIKQQALQQAAIEQEAARQAAIEQQQALAQAAIKQQALQQAAIEQEAARQAAIDQQQALKQAALKQQALQQAAIEQQAARQAAIEQQQAVKQAALKQQALQQAAIEQQAARQAAIEQQQALKQAALDRQAARQAVIEQQAMQQAAIKKQAAQQAAMEQQSTQTLSEQSMFSQTADQVNTGTTTIGTKTVPGLIGRPAGQMGNMAPDMKQLLALMRSSNLSPAKMIAGLNQAGMTMNIKPGVGSMDARLAEANAGVAMETDPGSNKVVDASSLIGPKTDVGPDMVVPGADISATQPKPPVGPKTPVGPDVMPKPVKKVTAEAEPTLTTTYTEPAAPQNVVNEKATDLSTVGANMIMDKAMMQNLMRMRLSPEMINYIKFGSRSGDLGGELGALKNIFKRTPRRQPAAASGQAETSAMLSTTNHAAETSVIDTGMDAGITHMGQSQMEQSTTKQDRLNSQAQAQNAAANMQTSIVEEQQSTGAVSQQNQQASAAESTSANLQRNNQQSDFMMSMGRLFGGNVGPLSGLMGGDTRADMSSVQYETANKGMGQVDVSRNQLDAKQAETIQLQTEGVSGMAALSGTSSTDKTSGISNAGLAQGSMFSGNQLMGALGFGRMNQGAEQSAIMSEVVSGPADQSTGPGSSQVEITSSSGAVGTTKQAAEQNFTPVGALGTWESIVGGSAKPSPKVEQTWTWDPLQQAWILLSVSDTPTTNVKSSQVQTEAAKTSSQDMIVQSAADQQVVATDVATSAQQAFGVLQGQVSAETGTQTVDQVSPGAWAQAGFRWDSATNAFVPIQTQEQSQVQAGLSASQISEVQGAVDTTATQGAVTGSQQLVSEAQAQSAVDGSQVAGTAQEQGYVDTAGQGTIQKEQTWAEAGYTWDAATNAFVPTASLQQRILGTSEASGISGGAASVEQTSMIVEPSSQPASAIDTGAADFSLGGAVQTSASVQVSAADSSQVLPIDSQRMPGVQTPLYEQANQLSEPVIDVVPPSRDVLPTVGQQESRVNQVSQPAVSGQISRLEMTGSQDVAAGVQSALQQEAQASVTAELAMQQGSKQADFTQWRQQQQALNQAQQTGGSSVQGQIEQQQATVQDSSFQAVQQPDVNQRSPTFDPSALQALSVDARSQGFQEMPQMSGAIRGPLMVDAPQWEQAATNEQQVSQQQTVQQQVSQQQVAQQQFVQQQQQFVEQQAEQQRIAEQQAAQQRIAEQQAEQRRIAEQQAEQQRIAEQQAAQQRIAEQAAQQRIAEQAAQQRIAEQQAEQQRIAEQQAAQQRIAEQQAAQQRIAEQAAQQRIAEQQAEQQRIAEQQAEQQRIAEQQAEQQRIAEQQAAQQRIAEQQAAQQQVTQQQATQQQFAEQQATQQQFAQQQATQQQFAQQQVAEQQAAQQQFAQQQASQQQFAQQQASQQQFAQQQQQNAHQMTAQQQLEQQQQQGVAMTGSVEASQQWGVVSNQVDQLGQQQMSQGQQVDPSGMAQAVQQQQQQQWGQGQGQAVQRAQQDLSQQVDVTMGGQTAVNQQPGMNAAQMTQFPQQQQWQAQQHTGAQTPPYQTVQAEQVAQTSAGAGAQTSVVQTQQWPQQAPGTQIGTAAAAQSAGMQSWSQSMQAQGGVQGAQTTSTQTETSFTPMGEAGSGSDATAMAWQALLAAAQSEAQKSGGPPTPAPPVAPAQPAAQQATAQQAQQTVSWAEIVKAAMAQQATDAQQKQATQSQQGAPQVPAWAAGLQGQGQGQVQQVSQSQQPSQTPRQQQPQQTKPPKTDKKKNIPVRPDPVTRAFVRDMFVKQMNQNPDVNPLHILIGLNPELLMKSGVNPRIAKSGDVSQIVPAVERALGISLRRRRGRGRGRGPAASIGGTFPDPMGGPGGGMDMGGMGPEPSGRRGRRPMSARDRAMQRRKFMMEQRMITEVMGMLGLGPEPPEPGDPNYRGPGQRRGAGGQGAASGGMGMGGPMGPPGGGAGMPGMGAGGPGGATGGPGRMMMELLGF